MNLQQQTQALEKQYSVVGQIDLTQWNTSEYEQSCRWLSESLVKIRRESFGTQERIVIYYTQDQYVNNDPVGLILKNLQIELNQVDITSCFVVLVTTNTRIAAQIQALQHINTDQHLMEYVICDGEFVSLSLDRYPYSQKETYQYGSLNPIKIALHELTQRERYLLTDSRTFCMYPWVHLHAFPTGEAHPCCYSEMEHRIGTTRTNTLQEIWNDQPMRDLRLRMLTEQQSGACKKCYEQEQHGFFSGRQSANKHFGHYVKRVAETDPDSGHLARFEMTYWDIRFSNLCNLRCRSCGYVFSSQWYQDQVQLAGPDWAKKHTALTYAGRTETDMWEQLIPHLDHVEQIYFAGGEPLMMEEHYKILDELERRGRFDVRLIYNTNFTHVKLKDRTVFDYWRRFKSVAVGASLDDQHSRGEYIRKGTDWTRVMANRREMIRVCPQVDFYISPTLSIMNAWSLPDFHREWVELGLIRPQDLNVNLLQDPPWYRIDIATPAYKQKLIERYRQHLSWLRPQDPLERASVGFESAINFLQAQDNTHMIPKFWAKTHELDHVRRERVLDIIPELAELT